LYLAAAAGFDNATKCLWYCFNQNALSKTDLLKVLRDHKAASDEMKSEIRERYDACIIALDGDDSLLDDIYGSYYRGDLKVKELNAALKAHRAGDRRGAEALLNEAKVRANR